MTIKPTSQDRVHTIEGRQYTLRFSFRAWALLADLWKLTGPDAAQQRAAQMSVVGVTSDEIVDMFWAALQKHHPDISREDAFEIADGAGVTQIVEIIGGLNSASSPPPDAAGAKKKPAPAR